MVPVPAIPAAKNWNPQQAPDHLGCSESKSTLQGRLGACERDRTSHQNKMRAI
jgi:hypothetical protein